MDQHIIKIKKSFKQVVFTEPFRSQEFSTELEGEVTDSKLLDEISIDLTRKCKELTEKDIKQFVFHPLSFKEEYILRKLGNQNSNRLPNNTKEIKDFFENKTNNTSDIEMDL